MNKKSALDRFSSLSDQWKNSIFLSLFAVLIYAPFLGSRVLRTAGDEKVYITQSLEMLTKGSWFLQTFAEKPDYFKGPLHYILTKIGVMIFGLNLWAGVYMNLFFTILGGVSLAWLVQSIYPKRKEWGFWAGAFFITNVGISGHLFASQMEVEVAGLFSFGFFLLWKATELYKKPGAWKWELGFWLVAGFAGWSKSPLHSVLIGVSAFLFWILQGQFVSRLKKPQTYWTAIAGILLCSLGYAPAFFLDRDNFVERYIIKETIKDGNGGPWWQAGLPIFTYYLIPWLSLVLASYFETIAALFQKKPKQPLTRSERNLLFLAIAGITPTLIFFTYHPYRGENYATPVTGTCILLFLFLLTRTETLFPRLRKTLQALGLAFFLVFCAAITSLQLHFQPDWWPLENIILIWLGLVSCFAFFLKAENQKEFGLGYFTSLQKGAFIVTINLVLMVFGEMEIKDLKAHVSQIEEQYPGTQLAYLNLKANIWNESGLISLCLGKPVRVLYNAEDTLDAIQNGSLILARRSSMEEEIRDLAKSRFPYLQAKTYSWRRWKTHASDSQGRSLVPRAWKEKNLDLLYDHSVIIRFDKSDLNTISADS